MKHLTGDIFGQVASASLQLTGHLQTLSFRRQNTSQTKPYFDYVTINGREQWASGDALHLGLKLDIAEERSTLYLQERLHFLPILTKSSNVKVGSAAWIGLILKPTSVEKGQFQRIGILEIVPDGKIPKWLEGPSRRGTWWKTLKRATHPEELEYESFKGRQYTISIV
jgi:hypothetical protein